MDYIAKQVVDKVEEIRLKTTILNKLTTEDIYSVLLQTLHNGKLFCIWNASANPNNELNLTQKKLTTKELFHLPANIEYTGCIKTKPITYKTQWKQCLVAVYPKTGNALTGYRSPFLTYIKVLNQ